MTSNTQEIFKTIFNTPLDQLFVNTVDHSNGNYPYYDIIKIEQGTYYICIALAGWKKEDLKVSVQDRVLTIKGDKEQRRDPDGKFIIETIRKSKFIRKFALSEGAKVVDTSLKDGMLQIEIHEDESDLAQEFEIN